MDRNHLALIYGRRDRNCCTLENIRCLNCNWNILIKECGTAKAFFKQSINPFRNAFNSFIVFMQTLTSTKFVRLELWEKNLAFTKMWRYNTKPCDPNNGKMGLPYFEKTRLLNGMKMPWYSVNSVFFCLEPTIRKNTSITADENEFHHCYGCMVIFLKSAILEVTWSQLCKAHW